MPWAVDHLVVAAASLAQGAAWCEAVLGVAPEAGGRHALMGTHNRLLAIGSQRFPQAYLEIIAIDPDAAPPGRPRWFDLDDPVLQARVAQGPVLVHWVARCADLAAEVDVLAEAGIDAGRALAAERDTPRGPLRWRIAVRDDGRRLADGALPTLIEWGAVHPAEALPARGIVLQELALCRLPEPVPARLPAEVRLTDTGPALAATLATRHGRVTLESPK